MNRSGQALVEFVFILSIFLFILFIIVDFGIIFSSLNSLENSSIDIINLLERDTNISEVEDVYSDFDIEISYSDDNKYCNVVISDQVDLITPGIGLVLDDPYVISVKRVFLND